ncbi:MAG: nicotinate-nucleotide adenylyltransferase [Spongiibacter sp.]|nr:nicotinate-nucleotide adenylyltransferase [Spongiibacter sp.]
MTAARHHTIVFGGTFDPIHHGHLRSAIELREALAAEELRLVPSHRPPLRGAPGADSKQRLAMVEAAIAGTPGLVVDGRELLRDRPSYTVDTLRQMRAEFGEDRALTWVMGSDAYNQLHRWQQWQSLFELANVLVIERADFALQPAAEVAEFCAPRRLAGASELGRQAAGGFYCMSLIQLPISASDIRDRIRCGRSIRYLVPDGVAELIHHWALYQAQPTGIPS